jgi:hypothetical protein
MKTGFALAAWVQTGGVDLELAELLLNLLDALKLLVHTLQSLEESWSDFFLGRGGEKTHLIPPLFHGPVIA